MAHQTRFLNLGMLGALAMTAAPATAQVAPPPEKAPEKEAEYVPAPPPPRPQPTKMQTPGAARQGVVAPNIPFPPLATKDENGMIQRLTRPPHLVALANNPTIGESIRDRVMPIVYQRHLNLEDRVLANLDLYLGFEQGMLDQLDAEGVGMEQLAVLTRSLKPLSEEGNIATDLERAGVLTATQRAMNDRIVREYKQQISEEIKLMHGQDINALFKSIIEGELVEPRYTYGLMVAELLQHPGAVEKAGLQGKPGTGEISTLIAAGWPDDNAARFSAVQRIKGALSNLSVDDHRALLQASRAMREDPNVPPIPSVDLVVEGSGVRSKIDTEGRMQPRIQRGSANGRPNP